MDRPSLFRFALLLAAAVSCDLRPSRAAAGCDALSADFDRAVAARSIDDAKRVEAAVFAAGFDCMGRRQDVRARRAALEVSLAEDPSGPLRSDGEREAALADAAERSDSWLASEKLGDLLFKQHRYAAAARSYDTGIERALQFAHPSDREKAELMQRAGAAKALASDDHEGTRAVPLAASRATDGQLGGIYSPGLRGAHPVAVPLPIQFDTGSAALTATGRQAADELVAALGQQGVGKVTLVGHTDTRGGDGYNMALSARRLDTVKAYLGSKGLTLDLTLVPKGKGEPFDLAVLPDRPTQEEAWALDRRVEWVRPPVE